MKTVKTEVLLKDSPSVHAAAVLETDKGMYYAWFGGSQEGAPDTSIYIRTPESSKLYRIKIHRAPHWNPVFAKVHGQPVLFFKIGRFCDCWQTIYTVLGTDKPLVFHTLPAGFNGPVKSQPENMREGCLLCGSSVETAARWSTFIEKIEFYRDFTVKSIDRSKAICTPEYKDAGLIQPVMWMSGGTYRCLMRSNSKSPYMWYSQSMNDWRTWSDPVEVDIPNPNSATSLVRDGRKLYLAYNPSSIHRLKLNVTQIAMVKGSSETPSFKVNDSLTVDCAEKEASYPYMIKRRDGLLELVYTYNRRNIKRVTIDTTKEKTK